MDSVPTHQLYERSRVSLRVHRQLGADVPRRDAHVPRMPPGVVNKEGKRKEFACYIFFEPVYNPYKTPLAKRE